MWVSYFNNFPQGCLRNVPAGRKIFSSQLLRVICDIVTCHVLSHLQAQNLQHLIYDVIRECLTSHQTGHVFGFLIKCYSVKTQIVWLTHKSINEWAENKGGFTFWMHLIPENSLLWIHIGFHKTTKRKNFTEYTFGWKFITIKKWKFSAQIFLSPYSFEKRYFQSKPSPTLRDLWGGGC